MTTPLNPSIIPLFRKQRFLTDMTEDDFRDKVVRPLYILKGLVHAKDICGNDEDGKDCYFFGQDQIRGRVLYAVQTKTGHVKMSSKARDNLLNIEAQLQTALSTPVNDAHARQKLFPDYVILAVSGEINTKAHRHIVDYINDPRIIFRDANALIPDIDKLMPELWYGIDVKRLPYLKRLRDYLVNHSETIDVSHILSTSGVAAPVSDDTFVQLYVNRYYTKRVRQSGRTEEKLEFEEFPIQDIVRRDGPLTLLTGDAGSGKTTSLRRLAMIQVQNSLQSKDASTLPVLVRCIDVTRSGQRLVVTAADVTRRFTPDEAPAFHVDDLVAGHVTLLIDGFDELTTEEARSSCIERIAEFHSEYPKCRIIVTSRDNPFLRGIIEQLPTFTRFQISPIHMGQAQKMIERLSQGKEISAEMTHDLVRRLEHIHGIDLSPLLVTVFVATTDYARTDIPANITELFKKFTELMLGRWDQSKGLKQQYQAQVKDFLLCRIAFKMQSDRATVISLDACRDIIENDLADRGLEADISVLFDELIYRSGLLRVDDEEVSFRHLLLQEFFAGRGIPSAEALRSLAVDYWWMRAIVFYFGEHPDDHKGLGHLRDSLEDVEGTDLFQAACAVGLAIQACYLTKTRDKIDVLLWVVETLAATKDSVLEFFHRDGHGGGLFDFIMYYLHGRDAVGARTIREVTYSVIADQSNAEQSDVEDAKRFWCIAGLLEAGHLKEAEELVEEFTPKDERLLLGLHMGAVYIENVRYTSDDQKRSAKRISKRIGPRISHLVKDVLAEMKSVVLEMQKDKVTALPAADSDGGAE